MEGKPKNKDDTNPNENVPKNETPSVDSNFSINSLGNVVPSKLRISLTGTPRASLGKVSSKKETKSNNSNGFSAEKKKPEIVNRVERMSNSMRNSSIDEKIMGNRHKRESSIKFSEYPQATDYIKKAREKAIAAAEGKQETETSSDIDHEIPEVRKKSSMSASRVRIAEETLKKRTSSSSLIGLASLSAFFTPFPADELQAKDNEHHDENLAKRLSIKFSDIKQETIDQGSRPRTSSLRMRSGSNILARSSKEHVRLSIKDDLRDPPLDDINYDSDDSLGLCIDDRGRVVPMNKKTKK